MVKEKEVVLQNGEKIESIGPWRIAWRKFYANKVAMAGLIIFVLIVLSVIFVPMIMGIDVNEYNFDMKNIAPNSQHLLGTDEQGRDVLFRLFLGGRISIMVGVIAAALTVILGCIVGGVAGYYGGVVDNLLMRFSEIVYSLPFTPMIIALSAVMLWIPQTQKMYMVSTLIGALSWPGLARLIRGQILTLREQEFMQACEALGISDFSKIFKHLMPNVFNLVIVNATLTMASAILTEAGLSFLGMGVVAPTPSWGNMMEAARQAAVFKNFPWQWIPAGIMCLLTVVSINLIGEGLRDAFDPKELN
ncbi:oligopeptide ABC transporter permease [Amedibacterium intestinale]|uniref:oligopeptide ABC transporter permease n=1 Tax=Amedibacterium intestinale TaxID=2583452 RepID=UPI000E4ACFBE|nr:oligopeptide ABC transporter permease [Amedibacterium intestinale]RHO30362.1 ABC transporter permease [Erysipelotrichaceae bacterium AM17-60]BBK62486.1 peptide ABC transporter permease [Amedibacterium intestinale]